MSYGIFKLVQPPTGVEHCIQAKILPDDEINLVVSKANFLQVFRVIESNARASLELVIEKRLFGNIESLNTLRLPGSSKDVLLLSFRDAKVKCYVAYSYGHLLLK